MDDYQRSSELNEALGALQGELGRSRHIILDTGMEVMRRRKWEEQARKLLGRIKAHSELNPSLEYQIEKLLTEGPDSRYNE